MRAIRRAFRPYLYGYITEVYPGSVGSFPPAKRYALGRFSHEMTACADQPSGVRTVCWMSDDGAGTILAYFVSDRRGHLSSGELFAARATQEEIAPAAAAAEVSSSQSPASDAAATSAAPPAPAAADTSFTLEWISLGRAAESDLIPHLRNTSFSDLFDTADPIVPPAASASFVPEGAPAAAAAAGTCPPGFRSINAYGVGQECLRVKEGKELLASRFETRRYAAYLGATSEFNKVRTTMCMNRFIKNARKWYAA
jgi:uncharacterized protein